jgi:hypothetical protein
MTIAVTLPSGLLAIGRGEASRPWRERFAKETLNLIRYADPAAWVVATAVAAAVDEAATAVAAAGVITVGERGPIEAMDFVARAAVEGFASPLRFVAAGPGTLAGVACIALGFRGPTLNLTRPLAEAVPVALFLTERWLARKVVPLVALAVCTHLPPDQPTARCLILAAREVGAEPTEPVASFEYADWLLTDAKGPEVLEQNR